VVGSNRFTSLAKKRERERILTLSQHTALFTERCCFQKLFGDGMKRVLDDVI
jgi:hypothetical protein